jgi:hypothetical protein
MNENAPCMECTEKREACHGSCERYKAWLERYHAQQKHLAENKYRHTISRSEARDRSRGWIK